MKQTVKTLMLFTLSACPMGRSMNQVIEEFLTHKKELTYNIVFVDLDDKTTNHFRIKTNPTTLFLDQKGKELYRIEGFKETEELWDLFKQIENGSLRSELPEENHETIETYTLYFYKDDDIVPIQKPWINKTSVKAPRITAIQQLLRTRPNGLYNPFPLDATLDQVSFEKKSGVVTLRSKKKVSLEETKRMEVLLTRTLQPYGIRGITVNWME